MASKCWAALSRRRLDKGDITADTALARVLGLVDLTALGVGATLGLGAYVLSGVVAKDVAGPAVCISFLIAAFASALAGLCYAEFAARVPKAGSAYVYSYVTVGEFVAFVIGWNLILEYVIGTASVARGFSNYLDFLIGNVMSEALRELMPINVSFLSEYPDFFASGMVLLLAVLLAVGVKESTLLNNIFTAINLVTIAIIIVAGSMKAYTGYWGISVDDIPEGTENAGKGGFMPFGWNGVLTGAATCFYAFVGFDTIATTGEEAKNPQRNIPWAIVMSLSIVCLAYFGIASVLTMMVPYYEQNIDAPFPYAFERIGWPAVKWIVNIGAVFALCTSMIGALFPLPRVLYAMANDGIIFKFFGRVNARTQTPLIGTMISGLLAAIMTLLFNLRQLIDMMSIGTLMAYGIVALCVLILRFQPERINSNVITSFENQSKESLWSGTKQLFNLNGLKEPTQFSGRVASWGALLYSFFSLVLGYVLDRYITIIRAGDPVMITITAVLAVIMIVIIIVISRQPVSNLKLSFRVPLVPLIPCISIFINLYLMLQLDTFTWIRFAIWLAIGFAIYFTYGIMHSEQGRKDKIERQELVQRKGIRDQKFVKTTNS